MSTLIGGKGAEKTLSVSIRGKRAQISARMLRWKLGLGVVTYPPEHTGKLVVPRWEDLEKLIQNGKARRAFVWKPEHITYQLVGTVYHAYRQTWHILARYGLDLHTGEKVKMREAAEEIRRLNLAVLGGSPGASVDETRAAMKDLIANAAHALGKPKKFSKREALEQLAAVGSGADRRGRPNPSVGMVRSRAAYARVLERLHDEIMAIDPHMSARQKLFINMIQLAELRLYAVNDFLALTLQRDGLKPLFDERQRLIVAAQCEYYAQDLEAIDFRPYRNACLETARDLRETRDLIRLGRLDKDSLLQIRLRFVKGRSAIAIKREQIAIERLIFKMMRAEQDEKIRFAFIKTINELYRVGRALRAVDERGFRRPVCEPARTEITSAARILHTGDRARLTEARRILKNASALL